MDKLAYLFIIIVCSSIKFPSPITIGPSLAIIVALGWTTDLGPIVILPSRVAVWQTSASEEMLAVVLEKKTGRLIYTAIIIDLHEWLIY